jgi:hypothetical protein
MSNVSVRRRLIDHIAQISDGAILRVAFYAMLAGTLTVLWFDYNELMAASGDGVATTLQPVLPAFDPQSPATTPGPVVTSDLAALTEPLTISLGAGGTLSLSGTIDPGSAMRFAAEIEARGEYVSTVEFDSPGGSVTDAVAIGELIRARGFATRVAAGRICASSCPLAFAGGVERNATAASAIGVHQIYAAVSAGELPVGLRAAGDAMSDAQKTTAAITRHLVAMEIDPAVWIHALETPPDRLYYLSPDELIRYELVTDMDQADQSALAENGGGS